MANVSGSVINDFIHDATDGLLPPPGSVNIALVTLYNDTMAGNNGNDSIYAGGGNDVLDGGLGADSMVGGIGNDVYFVGAAGDEVVEKPGGGIDSVKSTITYTLTSDVEKLILNGSAAINGTGNTLANTLTGNAAANSLVGLAGNDTLIGGDGNDTLNGGAGVDSLTGGANDDAYFVDNATDKTVELAGGGTDRVYSSVSFVLGVEVETLTLTGTAAINGTGNAANNAMTGNTAANSMNAGVGNDTLNGGTGNDTLNGSNGNDSLYGGTGVDSMIGGANNDLYAVDIAGDKVVELAGGGIDSVNSTVTFTLAAEVENLTLTGAAAINGTGNGLGNGLTGNAANSVLNGLAGNDTLLGMAGNDTLGGGDGNDRLTGGTGLDRVDGGNGNDLLVILNAGELVNGESYIGGAGTDTLDGSGVVSAASLVGKTLSGIEVITGFAGGLTLTTAQFASLATVDVSAVTLTTGGAVNLSGAKVGPSLLRLSDAGNSVTCGGASGTTVIGGAGDDTFIFNGASTATVTTLDDFSGLNTNAAADVLEICGSGAGLFYLGDAAFANDGQVQVRYAGSSTLQVDLDGDGQSDLAIVVQGMTASTDLTSTDFV